MNGLKRRNTDPEKHKLVFDRMMKKYGAKTMLVTPLIDTIVEENTVKGIVIHTKQGDKAIMGKRFVELSRGLGDVYKRQAYC